MTDKFTNQFDQYYSVNLYYLVTYHLVLLPKQ